jgi:hypothetical protein
MIELETESIVATIDPERGSDVLSLVHRPSGTDVLLTMPEPPDGLIATDSSELAWLQRYRGGWQTLIPVAGPEREVNGRTVGFHGEASISRWALHNSDRTSAQLSLTLTSVPVAIDRHVAVSGPRIQVSDKLTNFGNKELTIDYVAHPAFGGALLEGDCRLTTGAKTFTFDPDTDSEIASPGTEQPWPGDPAKLQTDLGQIPDRDSPRALLGWLGDLNAGWASIENLGTGLSATIDWDATQLPYAWLWQELQASEGFPWFRQVRTIAVEPASCQSGGPSRTSALSLGPGESVDIAVGITVEGTKE